MRIQNLIFENFRGFENLNIDFSTTYNTNVFIGVNGSGKSAILDGIAMLLAASTKVFSLNKFPTPTISNKPQIETDLKHGGGQIRLETTLAVNINTNMSVNIRTKTSKNETKRRLVEGIGINIDPTELSKNQLSLPALIHFKTDRATRLNTARLYKTDIPANSGYKKLTNPKETWGGDFTTWFRIEEDKENEIMRNQQDFRFRNPHLEVVRLAITTFFSVLNGEEVEQNVYTNFQVRRLLGNDSGLGLQKNGINFQLEQLSDGEKILILTVADIARELTVLNQNEEKSPQDILNNAGIVLIDEIDLHLHPRWQANVLTALNKTFPNIQFFVTTHSPQVLASIPTECVFILDKGVIKRARHNLFAQDPNLILESIMNTSKRPKSVKKFADKYLLLINRGKFSEAESLKQDFLKQVPLGDEDPIFLTAEAIIDRKNLLKS